jgi:hypothetical protein
MEKGKMQRVHNVIGVCMLGMLLPIGNANAQADEPGPGTPYKPLPTDKVVVTKVKHFGVMTWKIAAAGGTFYLENGEEAGGRSGVSSAFDTDGNDWIGADFSGRKNPEFPYNKVKDCYDHATRGFPKFTYLLGEYETPSKQTGAKTRWVDEAGKDVPFADKLEGEHLILRSYIPNTIEFEYHFFTSHIAIKAIKVDIIYAFHFQGLIGGEPERSPKDYVVFKDGVKRDIKENYGIPEGASGKQLPPFLYMADSDEKKTQVFFMGAKNLPATHEDEGWLGTCPDKSPIIAVFSYGRKPGSYNGYTLTGTEPIFIFGFQAKTTGHEGIASFIEARLAEPLKPGAGSSTGGGTGGATATGGQVGSGGATATGGQVGSGGMAGTGGVIATGGSTAQSGGSSGATGGTQASGGTSSNPGSGGVSTGGQISTGGTQSNGGSANKADAGTATSAKSSSGCTMGQAGDVGSGMLLLCILGWVAVMRSSRINRRKN